MSARPRFTFHLIPHTHWDREWYLPRAEFQARLVPVMDAVLDQLERDPEARFLLDGQTILLEDYLAIRPEQEERIRTQVRRGALEVGPWYVLADLVIPSAASLRRNLEEGRRQAERFGRCLDVLYSPDAFGHPAGLPALAAAFGLRRAVVRRGLGRPGDFYRWEAPTGEALLVHHLPPAGYDGAIGLATAGADLGRAWRRIRQELVERATTGEIAVFLGADHHAMVPGVTALRDRLQELEPDAAVRVSGLGEYFDAVERDPPAAPTLRGALRRSAGYTWDLPDVRSARSRLKRRHALAELRLARIAEPLVQGSRADHRTALLAHAWRILLQCQFHDTLAGTTCDAAQREQELRLEAVDRLSHALTTGALAGGPGEAGPRLILWNPVDRPRQGVMLGHLTFFREDILVGPPSGRRARTGPGYRPFALAPAEGNPIPVQVLAIRGDTRRRDRPHDYPDLDRVDRVWVAFEGPPLPPRGSAMLRPVGARSRPTGPSLVTGPGTLGNAMVSARVSETATLTLTDPATNLSLSGLLGLMDEPDRGDLYTFSPAGPPEFGHPAARGPTIVADGPLLGAIETRWTAEFRSGRLDGRMLAVLLRDSPIVRVRLDLDNRGRDHRLRLRFPLGRGTVIAGATTGTDRVPPAPARHPFVVEREVATAPAQRFVAAVTDGLVFAVLLPGFFEYEWTSRGELRLTAFRAIGELSRPDLPERPGHAAWPTPVPDAQELGPHTLELGLAILASGAPDPAGQLERLWEDAFLPVLGVDPT